MKAPSIFIIVKHSEFYEPMISWWFDEQQAEDIAKQLNTAIGAEYVYQVEGVPAGEVPAP